MLQKVIYSNVNPDQFWNVLINDSGAFRDLRFKCPTLAFAGSAVNRVGTQDGEGVGVK